MWAKYTFNDNLLNELKNKSVELHVYEKKNIYENTHYRKQFYTGKII